LAGTTATLAFGRAGPPGAAQPARIAIVSNQDARTPERVVAAVESLRQATPAFEQQMTVVHDLLLAAGQVNLGQGRPALDVVFGGLGALAVAADGTLYLDAIDDSRIWRMGADGTVQTVAGRGGAGDRLAADGWSALDVYLYHPVGFALDPQCRVVVAESTSQSPFGPYIFPPSDDHAALYRLDAQGRIEMLWQPGKGEHQWPRVVAPDAAGNVQVLNIRGEVEAWPSEHWTIGPDKARRMVRRFSTADGDVLYRSLIWGHDAKGRFYMAEPVQAPKSNTLVYRYDPARDGLEQLADGLKENLAGLTVTAGGEILALKADRSLELRLPDGTRRTVLAKLPPEYGVDLNAAALAPDGTLYVVLDKGPFPGRTVLGPGRTYAFEDALVFRIRDGALTQVAGTEGTRRSGPATDLALLEPHGAAGGPDGRMYVADGPANRIWVVDANKQAVPFAGTGETGEAGDGGPAASAQVSDPNVPHVDAAGNVTWIESDSRLRTATPAGVIATRYVPTRGHYLQDLAIAPDGTAYFLEQPSIDGSDPFELRKLPPGAKTATVLSNAAELKGATRLALAPDGSVYVTGGKDHDTYYTGYLLRWSAAKGVERLSTDPRYYTSEDEAGLAVAADGKVYVTGYLKYDETALMRYDPATGALEVLTGDDGLLS
jgi:sugar lactone lactonase YvrE